MKILNYIPANPATSPNSSKGWMLMLIALTPLLPETYRTVLLNEYVDATTPTLFFGTHFIAGWWLTLERGRKPKPDNLRFPFAVLVCFMWIGVCLSPLMTNSGSNVASVGFLIWSFTAWEILMWYSRYWIRKTDAEWASEVLDGMEK